MVILNLGLDMDPPGYGFTKKPGSGSGYHDYGSNTLLKNQLDF
jgi:hypothetical protein